MSLKGNDTITLTYPNSQTNVGSTANSANYKISDNADGYIVTVNPGKLIVYGADFSKINRVQAALASAVGKFNMSSYEGGRALFTVQYGGTPQNLFDEIQANTDADLELQSISYSRLTISVR